MCTSNIKPFVLLLLFCLTVFIGDCSTPPGGDPITSISGFVTDSLSGLPIDSAAIQLIDTVGSPIFYSDSLGKYTAGRFGYGTFLLFCRKTKYQTKSVTIQSSKENFTFRDVDFQLVKHPDST
jgi:hypothetical protein